MKYAIKTGGPTTDAKDSDESDDDGDYSKFGSKKQQKADKEARAKELAD